MSALFYECQVVAFTGSEANKRYHNKKLVLFDNNSRSVIASTQFNSVIKDIKALKQLIIVQTRENLNICRHNENKTYIETCLKISIASDSPFSIWMTYDKKYEIATISEKCVLNVTKIFENSLETEKSIKIDTKLTSGIQTTFYCERSCILFAVDLAGVNINGYKISSNSNKAEYELIFQLYRGKSEAQISSITTIRDNYVAIISSHGTIHIFDFGGTSINNGNNSSNGYFSKFYTFLTNPYDLNKSLLKIRLNEDVVDDEGYTFFELDYKLKGSILYYDDITDELVCLSYNGKIYRIALDFKNLNYSIKSRMEWCSSECTRISQYISEEFQLDLNHHIVSDRFSTTFMKEESPNIENKWKII